MIELTQGDILQADAEALVNTVNCVGVMGRGIALQFRKAYPDNYREYKAVCDRGELEPGRMLVVNLNTLHNPKYIINFPTKRHWKGKSRIEDIDAGLQALIQEIRNHRIHSIAIPPLGCGLGGLDWEEVHPLIEKAFRELTDVQVLLYEPAGAPTPEKMAKSQKEPKMTLGRATVLLLMRQYLVALMDPSVSLLEIHKLMYFMQEAGEPLRLRYQKGLYGPYAENLRHVLSEMEGYFITGYGDAEDDPEKQIELNPEASEKAEKLFNQDPDRHERFARVVGLIKGFETPYAMELLATVHWVAKYENASEFDDTLTAVYAWNDRKRMFQEKHVRIAWEILNRQGWVPTEEPGS